MCRIVSTMDAALYLEILQDELLQTMEDNDLDQEHIISQQDNDPKHRAKRVQEWLQVQQFDVMDWPPQSPDLNPIEHLWSIMKRHLGEIDEQPSGMIDLWKRTQEAWNSISEETCRSLISSMPRRILAVIRAKGRWTKY